MHQKKLVCVAEKKVSFFIVSAYWVIGTYKGVGMPSCMKVGIFVENGSELIASKDKNYWFHLCGKTLFSMPRARRATFVPTHCHWCLQENGMVGEWKGFQICSKPSLVVEVELVGHLSTQFAKVAMSKTKKLRNKACKENTTLTPYYEVLHIVAKTFVGFPTTSPRSNKPPKLPKLRIWALQSATTLR